MILPDVILYQLGNEKLRKFILDNFKINYILNMGDVFKQVVRPSAILIFENSLTTGDMQIADFSAIDKANKAISIFDQSKFKTVSRKILSNIPNALFITSNLEITKY